jgi:hypothetical protein
MLRGKAVATAVVAAVVGGAMGCGKSTDPGECADLVLVGGVVHTVDPVRPRVEGMAVRGSRLLAVGSTAEVEAFQCPGTTRIDLDGQAVIPGLIDAHAHLLSLGRALRRVDLVGTTSYEEVLERVAARIATARPGEWILGRGWDQNDWPRKEFPDRARLDAISGDNPVMLGRIDGHAVLANGLALAAGGIREATPDPPGGEILRDASGRPTGVLIDNATDPVENAVPSPGEAEDRDALDRAMEHCLSVGLTGVHDAGIDLDDWDRYRRLADAGELRLRIYAMVGWGPRREGVGGTGAPGPDRPPEIGRADGMLTVRAVKLYADGALGSRGAALLADYGDRPGHRGLLVNDPAHLEEQARAAAERGFQVAIHAIGDRGNREVLDIYERLAAAHPGADLRPRVEHAQVLAPQDVARFAKLGAVPSMQPTHCTSDMYWAADRLGPERLAGAYAWRSLLEAGVGHLPLGSDFPVESANPFWGLYAAVTRQDAEGFPEGGWNSAERLSLGEALRGFTIDAAWAGFQEADLGSLSPGKYADFVILDRDPMTVAPRELRDTRVLQTWVGGRRAWPGP